MVSYQGTFEFFNNTFAFPEEVYKPKVVMGSYPKNTVMWYIDTYHPKFAFIVKKAQMDMRMADPQFLGTVFLPLEESIDEDSLLNMDMNTANKIVRYTYMRGLYPRRVIYTSPYQQLQSSMDGAYIWATITDKNIMVLNYTIPVVYWDITLDNGMIHVIDGVLNRP
jgi:hypothetical protein